MKKNKGAALITVLVMVFLVMAMITNMMVKNYRVIRKLNNHKILTQAQYYLFFAIDFGRMSLFTCGLTLDYDYNKDLCSQPLPKTEIANDFWISGYISDELAKFNINDLIKNGKINKEVLDKFSNLLIFLKIPSSLANSIALYMASAEEQGDLRNQYTLSYPPYLPASRAIVDLSELSLVKGIQAVWLYKLNNYITAIPKNESDSKSSESESVININSASAEVIAAKTNLDLAIAQRIVALRNSEPFKNAKDITEFFTKNGIMTSRDDDKNNYSKKINTNVLSAQSNYFTIHAVVDKGDYQFQWVAYVNRPFRKSEWPRVLWQRPE